MFTEYNFHFGYMQCNGDTFYPMCRSRNPCGLCPNETFAMVEIQWTFIRTFILQIQFRLVFKSNWNPCKLPNNTLLNHCTTWNDLTFPKIFNRCWHFIMLFATIWCQFRRKRPYTIDPICTDSVRVYIKHRTSSMGWNGGWDQLTWNVVELKFQFARVKFHFLLLSSL